MTWKLSSSNSRSASRRISVADDGERRERADADVQMAFVVEHAHFGAIGCRLPFLRLLLHERVDHLRRRPRRLVEHAVDARPLGGLLRDRARAARR